MPKSIHSLSRVLPLLMERSHRTCLLLFEQEPGLVGAACRDRPPLEISPRQPTLGRGKLRLQKHAKSIGTWPFSYYGLGTSASATVKLNSAMSLDSAVAAVTRLSFAL